MSDTHNLRQALAFERWWDRLTGGRTVDSEPELDPGLEAFARRVHALDEQLPANHEFKNKLWEDLMIQTVSAGTIPLTASAPMRPSLNGVAPTRAQPNRQDSEPVSRHRWFWGRNAIAQFSLAAVLLITLFGIYRFSWDGRAPNTGPNGAAIPAVNLQCESAERSPGTTSSPVALNTFVASPNAGASDPVTFVWENNGELPNPAFLTHMAIDPQCRLWVLEQQESQFAIFDLNGTLLETWGVAGSGDGEFDFANSDSDADGGIAFAPDGGFYVADAANERIQQFDAERAFVRAWAIDSDVDGTVGAPSWIAVGPDDNVYVAVDTNQGMIQVFTPEGSLIRKFGSVDPGPDHLSKHGPIAFDPMGRLWVLDRVEGGFLQFSPEGEIASRFDPSELGAFDIRHVGTEPIGLAIDATGRFFVSDHASNGVFVYDANGTFLYTWGGWGLGQGEFFSLFGIVLDGDGGVYLSDGGVPRIQKFHVVP